jgi:CheY-like chemotaxis protein
MTLEQQGPCGQCPRGERGFVLVVDDDVDGRYVVCQALKRHGYRVREATNAREALNGVQAGPAPCAILLDLAMPIMDGWQFMAERRWHAALARVPVALMSGSIDRRALVLDADAYLQKPFDATQLLAVVAQCCGVRRCWQEQSP